MGQLGQLQKKKGEFDKLGVKMVAVFREELDGVEGAKKATRASGFSPILLDTPVNKTKAYSQKDFVTYLIGKDGEIKAELSGSKKVRPTAEDVLAKAKELFVAPSSSK